MKPLNVVIIGAPRSGTNMLRDVLTSVDGVASWPCDEINLLWRHGNRDAPSDALPADGATPQLAAYMRSRFERIRARYRSAVVVEKTCANSLRVEFVRAVVPEAKFILITRDGADAAASAMQRWHAPFDSRYALAKARFVPVGDIVHYGHRFAITQLRRRMARGYSSGGRLASWWGPRPDDWRELMCRPLEEVCALQWKRCVESSLRGIDGLDEDQLIQVRYEDFVRRPDDEAARLMRFLGIDSIPFVGDISSDSVGRGRAQLGEEKSAHLDALLGDTMRRVEHG